MMDNPLQCWHETNIDISNAIKAEWQYPTPPANFGIWNYPARAIFNDDWLEYMEKLDLTVVSSILFYRNAWVTDARAHVDTEPGDSTRNCVFGLNWVIGGEDSEMIWYQNPTVDAEVLWTPANLPYQAWPLNQLTPINKQCIQSTVTLVRTDLPHSVNNKHQMRWCFSIRLPNKFIPWEEVVKSMLSKGLLSA